MKPLLRWLIKFFVEEDVTTLVQLMEKSDLFGKLTARDIIAIAQKAKRHKFNADETIIKENEIAESCFVIETGSVRIFTTNPAGNNIVLARLEQGAYFGEQAILEPIPGRRNASAIAITDVSAFEFHHHDITPILSKHHKIKQTLLTAGKKQQARKILKQFDFFAADKDDLLSSLTGDILEFSDQQIIFSKGDTPRYAYFILSGQVNIILDDKDATSVTRLGQNQLFGELGLVKKQPRKGTAKADGATKVIAISAENFNHLYTTNKQLRNFVGALDQVYTSTARGTVTISQGSLFGMDTINSTFNLPDGRIATASHVIGEAIFHMQIHDAVATDKLHYKKNHDKRELTLMDKKIIGVTCHGSWQDLGYVCSLILDDTPIDKWYLNLFKTNGNITVETKATADIVCHCMRITQGTIVDAIKMGCRDINSIASKTSAGTICGSCRPTIQSLLGRENWFIVYIHKVTPLSNDIRSYQLKPYSLSLPQQKPGQHIVLQGLIDNNWIERSYTLVSVSPDYYEIVVKREPQGIFSTWLFENDQKNPFLRVSAPQGDFIFAPENAKPAIFFAGGIGITPAVAFARALNSSRELYLHYSARIRNVLIFSDELSALMTKHKNFHLVTRITQAEGRLTEEQIRELVFLYPSAEFFICGPASYEKWIVDVLKKLRVDKRNIKIEEFTPAGGPIKKFS